jgi:hypothetical protein
LASFYAQHWAIASACLPRSSSLGLFDRLPSRSMPQSASGNPTIPSAPHRYACVRQQPSSISLDTWQRRSSHTAGSLALRSMGCAGLTTTAPLQLSELHKHTPLVTEHRSTRACLVPPPCFPCELSAVWARLAGGEVASGPCGMGYCLLPCLGRALRPAGAPAASPAEAVCGWPWAPRR